MKVGTGIGTPSPSCCALTSPMVEEMSLRSIGPVDSVSVGEEQRRRPSTYACRRVVGGDQQTSR